MNRVPLMAAIAVAAAIPALAAQTASAAAYRFYGSCADSKPYTPATHCTYDEPGHSRTTFVFRSSVGQRDLEVCQRITGLPFKGHHCTKSTKAFAYLAIPNDIKDPASRPFRTIVTVKVRTPGSSGPYRTVAQASLRVSS